MKRPAYQRAVNLIDELERQAGSGRILHGGLKAALIAEANAIDSGSRNRGLIGTAISGGMIFRHPRDRASGNVK